MSDIPSTLGQLPRMPKRRSSQLATALEVGSKDLLARADEYGM
jgi:hypothetical protein